MTILRGGILFVTTTRVPVCLESEKSCISNIYLKKKNLAASAGDVASISESGRSPGEGKSNSVQYSCWRSPWTEGPGGPDNLTWGQHYKHQLLNVRLETQWREYRRGPNTNWHGLHWTSCDKAWWERGSNEEAVQQGSLELCSVFGRQEDYRVGVWHNHD